MSWQYLRATINGGFWGKYQKLVRDQVIPYQWKALKDEIPNAPRSHSIENFRIAAGLAKGEYDGLVFQDSDLFKWLEAAGHSLADKEIQAEELRGWVEEAIELIAKAQQPDGYLNTYFTVKEPARRWKNLREAHELYCAGHLIEAGVAVYRGTGNRKILDVVSRLADHIDSHFGVEPGKVRGYCGHEEVELALVKLYRATGNAKYLKLAQYFVDERGRSPSYFEKESSAPDYVPIFYIRELDYYQAHMPVREQKDAVGHAVRAMYLSTAMADLALESGDESLAKACERLWESATQRRMYVTGGIGSSARHEAFTSDFDLPNDTAYAETCAAIGLFTFSNRMANLRHDSRFADVMELALYNGILSGLALDGRGYFYVNPLEVHPDTCDHNATYQHVKYRRQPWYGCACCPPNIARIVASLGEYAYHASDDTLYADLFHDGVIEWSSNGQPVTIREQTDYPWSDDVTFTVARAGAGRFQLAIRIPSWCADAAIAVNGEKVALAPILKKGYAVMSRAWKDGDTVRLTLPMKIERVHADPRVRADWGKSAVRRGPVIYCLEEVDNGPNLHTIEIAADAKLTAAFRSEMFGGVYVVAGKGHGWSGTRGAEKSPVVDRDLLFVPYYTWANRDPGEMIVWTRE